MAEIAEVWRGRGQAAGLSMRDIETLNPGEEVKCEAHIEELRAVLAEIVHANSWADIEKFLVEFRREYKFTPKKNVLWHLYQEQEQRNPILEKLLVTKGMRSLSGVLVVTVLTSAYPEYTDEEGVRRTQRFSCKHNCYYCPSEPAHAGNNFVPQPRSYLHDEPGVLRANQNGFDAVRQFRDRINTYLANGHPIDKIEVLVLGGTWSEYPLPYQREFVRDLFYAANTTFADREERLSLEEEVLRNASTAQARIIGLTLETRPDTIDADEVRRLREYQCTRVQLGVQHTDEAVLRKVNRGHGVAEVQAALRLLKDNCFKVDIHLMPNLPGTTVESDAAMFERVLTDPELQADQWKIYPCSVVPWSVIENWLNAGSYKPYKDDVLLPLLLRAKASVHPWIRLNRVVRDIPSGYISGGCETTNMRQHLLDRIKKSGIQCRCIRCREVKDGDFKDPTFKVRRYMASGGVEYFLSFESPDEKVLYGFLRLRIPSLDGLPRGAGTGLSGLVSEEEVAEAAAGKERMGRKRAAAARRAQREADGGRAAAAAHWQAKNLAAATANGNNNGTGAGDALGNGAANVNNGVAGGGNGKKRRKNAAADGDDDGSEAMAAAAAARAAEAAAAAAAADAAKACAGGWLGTVARSLSLCRRRARPGVMPELAGCALIRELHVYGQLQRVGDSGIATQHRGIGSALLREAEALAVRHGFWKTAVISGVGVRRYYERFGYRLCGHYHIKELVDARRLAALAAAAAAAAATAAVLVLAFRRGGGGRFALRR